MTRKPAAAPIWTAPDASGGKLHAPAAERNKDAILEVLREVLSAGPVEVLEVAAGTGQHAAHFASACPQATWWPADLAPSHLDSIEAYRRESGLASLMPPQMLDVTVPDWSAHTAPEQADFILCCNMIHIAPWAACLGLLEGAGQKLRTGGRLMLYGPFRREGVETAASNEAFDASLKQRDPEWGLRLLEDVAGAARPHGLELERVIEMPANNLSAVFKRS
jgi:SAM-dependent methyltransferase